MLSRISDGIHYVSLQVRLPAVRHEVYIRKLDPIIWQGSSSPNPCYILVPFRSFVRKLETMHAETTGSYQLTIAPVQNHQNRDGKAMMQPIITRLSTSREPFLKYYSLTEHMGNFISFPVKCGVFLPTFTIFLSKDTRYFEIMVEETTHNEKGIGNKKNICRNQFLHIVKSVKLRHAQREW